MKTIYIAGPYTKGDHNSNIRTMFQYMTILMDYEFAPFAPLTSTFVDMIYPKSYEAWMSWCLHWIERCDILIRIPGESAGADREVEKAQKLGIPVFYVDSPQDAIEQILLQS